MFQVIRNSRLDVNIHPGSLDSANLMVATIKKAKERKFCCHSLDDLREANCDSDVQAARSSAELHRIPIDEFCQACDSNLQDEVKSLLTIIPPLKKVLCVSYELIRDFRGDHMDKCTAC